MDALLLRLRKFLRPDARWFVGGAGGVALVVAAATRGVSWEPVAVLPPDPIARFDFDRDLRDATGNGFDGDARGSIEYVPSPHGYAIRCVPPDGYVGLDALGVVFAEHLRGFTVHTEAYVERGQGYFWAHIEEGEDERTNATALRLEEGEVTFLTEHGAGRDQLARLGRVRPGWHTYTLVVDGSSASLFIDGERSLDGLVAPAQTQNLAMSACGYRVKDTQIVGMIDTLVVFDRPLSAAEVAAL